MTTLSPRWTIRTHTKKKIHSHWANQRSASNRIIWTHGKRFTDTKRTSEALRAVQYEGLEKDSLTLNEPTKRFEADNMKAQKKVHLHWANQRSASSRKIWTHTIILAQLSEPVTLGKVYPPLWITVWREINGDWSQNMIQSPPWLQPWNMYVCSDGDVTPLTSHQSTRLYFLFLFFAYIMWWKKGVVASERCCIWLMI